MANSFTAFHSAIEPYLPFAFTALAILAASLTSLHVILSRREPGSSIAWMALVWLAPLVGVISYLTFGINRIKRRAVSLRRGEEHFHSRCCADPVDVDGLDEHLDLDGRFALRQLVSLVDHVVDRPLLPGNEITPLFNGDETYPAMLEAIEESRRSVHLATYIFDNDNWGRRFVSALEAAHRRGVEVRVLVDAAGLRYSFPSVYRRLKRAGVQTVRFLPSVFPPHFMSINLRNHRKILVIDGEVGFTGGINLRDHHVLADNPPSPARDLHFRVRGPVVAQFQEIFAEDWHFSTGEDLRQDAHFPELTATGSALARGIPDGPDDDIDKLRWTIKGAISTASERLRIVTPYFIPEPSLVSALAVASLRGVQVDIVLPGTNNLPYVHWASMAHLRPLLERGCHVYFTPPPFDHSKLMIIDETWMLFGSANIDPRSLRLNFEFNVECWDRNTAKSLDQYINSRIDDARQLTLEEYDERMTFLKIRDGVAALMSPYL